MKERKEYLTLPTETRIIISKITPTPKGGTCYSPYYIFDNYRTAAEWVNDQNEKTYCIVINPVVPLHPYFDIERHVEPLTVSRPCFDDWINDIISVIGDCFNF